MIPVKQSFFCANMEIYSSWQIMQQMYNRAMSVLICVVRFLVCLETVKPDKPDATVSLKEIKFIDVPAHAKRDYECFVLFCFLHTQRVTPRFTQAYTSRLGWLFFF